jgi:hypothetical protein
MKKTMGPPLLGLAAFLLLTVLSPSSAARAPKRDTAPAPVRDTLVRDVPLGAGGRVTIDTTRGDIHVSAWDRELVELRAERTADRGEDIGVVPIDIQSGADELNVTSKVPVYASGVRVRVNYQLRVPSRVDLKSLATMTGDIVVSGVSGRTVVRAENGNITVRGSSGLLDLMSSNGQIDASPAEISEDASLRLETYNGDILLTVPAKTRNARFELRSLNGTIRSEIPFDIARTFGPQWVHEVASNGGPLVCAYSANGDITVRRR